MYFILSLLRIIAVLSSVRAIPEMIERCVPDRVILTVGNVHLNHVNECYCFVTKAQLCGAPPTE